MKIIKMILNKFIFLDLKLAKKLENIKMGIIISYNYKNEVDIITRIDLLGKYTGIRETFFMPNKRFSLETWKENTLNGPLVRIEYIFDYYFTL